MWCIEMCYIMVDQWKRYSSDHLEKSINLVNWLHSKLELEVPRPTLRLCRMPLWAQVLRESCLEALMCESDADISSEAISALFSLKICGYLNDWKCTAICLLYFLRCVWMWSGYSSDITAVWQVCFWNEWKYLTVLIGQKIVTLCRCIWFKDF